MKKNARVAIVVIAVLAVVVFGVTFLGIKLSERVATPEQVLKEFNAAEDIAKRTERLSPATSELRKSALEFEEADEAADLPELKDDTITVRANTSLYAEIFATSEKVGKNADGWMNEVAEAFNKEGFEVDGQKVSVQLRNVSSGLGYDYIRTGKAIPDGYSPSNALYISMLKSNGVETQRVTDCLVKNYAGIAVDNGKYKELQDTYGSVNLKAVTDATADNLMVMGYTSVYTSGTGFNFLVSDLVTYDPSNPLSDTAIAEFQKFQQNIPYIGLTTSQLINASNNGSFDGFVTEYQAYLNKPEVKASYTFVPFGYLHNNPLVSTSACPENKREILEMFAEYCTKPEWQKKAADYGFNQDLNYTVEIPEVDGDVLIKAQKVWKETKDNGKDIIAVFVCDLSGSMNGAKLHNMQNSLISGMQYINDNNMIGLVSYESTVTIDVPIQRFDLNQKAYFKGAIEGWTASGGTATYDAIVVACDMLLKKHEEFPDAKMMLFLASDGDEMGSQTRFTSLKDDLQSLKIPIYTIGYEATISALEEISNINEAATINADVDDVNYQIKNLFNSSL